MPASPTRSPASKKSYQSIARSTSPRKPVVRKDGTKGKHRTYKGHIFPKASLRHLAVKAGFARVRGTSSDENAYDYMDEKMFMLMQKVLRDAEAIANVSRCNTIKERHIAMALERRGVIGLASDEARREIALQRRHKVSKKPKAKGILAALK